MVVNAIYHGSTRIQAVYRGSQLIFQGIEPIEFHVFDGNKLIIRGAMSALPLENGLYLDCSPQFTQFYLEENGELFVLGAISALPMEDGLYLDCSPEWTYPELNNGVLTIRQAHTATMNGSTLEVK